MKNTMQVKNIMTKNPISIYSEVSLLQASDIMVKNGFNGLPVVDKTRKVIGIITEYDLLSKGTRIHLPTFMKLFAFSLNHRPDRKPLLQSAVADSLDFTVKDVMNPDPICVRENESIEELVKIFSEHHRVNPIPIIDDEGILRGIVSRYDVIRFYARMYHKAKKINLNKKRIT